MPHLINPEQLWASAQKVLGYVSEIFGKPEPVPKELIIPVTEGSFDLDYGAKLRVFETFGHASHNLGFQESLNGGVFTGDSAGAYLPVFNVVLPTTPPPFYLDSALASLDKLTSLNPTALYYSHFGKATKAVQRLKDYKIQLQLWAKIAEEGVRKNQSLEKIRERIIGEDKAMNLLAGYLKSHRIYSRAVFGKSVQGFIDYAKQIQDKPVS